MFEIVFLFILALIWILFATIQDLRTREVSNWLNFSLIIFAIGFRLFYSLFSSDWNFLFQGLIGLGIFFVIGNVFYYCRIFAGGDAKLLISLGAILPVYNNFLSNLKVFVLFLILFLIVGAFYGLIYSFVLVGKNFKSFKKGFFYSVKNNKKTILIFAGIAILFAFIGFVSDIFFYFGILFFVSPYLFIYAKTLEKNCLVKRVNPKQLKEGDWLLNDIRVGSKTVRASWNGLDSDQIKLLKKFKKEVYIKEGIPFVPVFLISFLILFALFFSGVLEKIFLLF